MSKLRVGLFCLLLTFLVCCKKQEQHAPIAISLVQNFKSEMVQNRVHAQAATARTEWRFDKPPEVPSEKNGATFGWEAATGISNLKIQNGRLTGKSTTDLPILHFERTKGLDDADVLHAIEIRMRASAGNNVSMAFNGSEKIDLQEIRVTADSWRTKSTITTGADFHTYTLKTPRPTASSSIRQILIRPVDEENADFEIESVRFIFRKEHLASIPSGPGWQGLSQIYQETVVSRAPEKIVFRSKLPQHAWLDLSIGTVEQLPVTFKIGVRTDSDTQLTSLAEQTVTMPYRWEALPIDLGKYSGQEAELSLSLSSEKAGAVGFWGSPTIRSHGSMPSTFHKIANDPPQGVILIWADTLRRDHLNVYGYSRNTAPNIARLASQGALFQDHIVQGTWTKVSTPSLMTSLYPTSHGVHDFYDRLPSSATTMAEVFHNAGYATINFSSILFTGAFSNLHQGFDQVHEDSSLPDQESSKTARIYVDRLLPWLETHRDVPFFVFLHVSDPHDPYRPYPPYDTMWANGSKADEHEKQSKEIKNFISDPLMKLFGMPTRADLVKAKYDPDQYVQMDRDWYDGSIRAMDAEIGRLLEHIKSLNLEKKIAVAFVGDHGEEFLEHGRTFHGQSVYGELTNTPLILWSPGRIPAGQRVDETVEAIDVMPTLLQLSNLPVPAEAQGESLLPLIAPNRNGSGEAEAQIRWVKRPAITEKASTHDTGAPPPRETEYVSIVYDGWKLIHNKKRPNGKAEFELYDEKKDPLNQQDLASKNPEIVSKLSKLLQAWQTKVKSAQLKPDSEVNRGMSPEELERLRSLGYIQ